MAIWCNKEKIGDKVVDIITRPTEFTKGNQGRPSHFKNVLFFGTLFTLLLIVSIASIMVIQIKYQPPNVNLYLKKTFQEPPGSTTTSITENTTFLNSNATGNLRIVSRREWLAKPSLSDVYLNLPVPYVVICHTATENCTDQASCNLHVRSIQTFHMVNRHWDDIAYNFLIGADGFVYEGTGWKFEGAHTLGYNANGMGIAFIGNFNQYLPSKQQINAAKQLIQIGVKLGYIGLDYKLVAARQLTATESPGIMLYEIMKTWPHWTENP